MSENPTTEPADDDEAMSFSIDIPRAVQIHRIPLGSDFPGILIAVGDEGPELTVGGVGSHAEAFKMLEGITILTHAALTQGGVELEPILSGYDGLDVTASDPEWSDGETVAEMEARVAREVAEEQDGQA